MKRIRILVILLAVAIVFAATPVVLADQYATYHGRCTHYFTTSTKLNKPAANTWFDTWNWYTYLDGYDENGGSVEGKNYTQILCGGTSLAEGPLWSGDYSGEYHDPSGLYSGQLYLRVWNKYYPGQYIYTEGDWSWWYN